MGKVKDAQETKCWHMMIGEKRGSSVITSTSNLDLWKEKKYSRTEYRDIVIVTGPAKLHKVIS